MVDKRFKSKPSILNLFSWFKNYSLVSGIWKINLHVRLEEPQPAYDILRNMLTEVSLHPRQEDSRITPSFEGNQAIQDVTASVTKMLMQRQENLMR
jgi:alpha-L-fucosidase 2